MNNWKEYSGSDEQIAEIEESECGIILRKGDKEFTDIFDFSDLYPEDIRNAIFLKDATHYWVIPDDPLREMKIRQAQTGQPVWIRKMFYCGIEKELQTYVTTTPDWNIPNAEYSFKEFE